MDDDLFDELILRWDEFREQGRKLTPDALMAIAQESGLLPKRMSPAEREALLEKLTQEIGIHANFPRPPGPVTPIRISTEYDTVTFYDRGGLGVVSLAKDPTLKREIAIKCIGSNLVNDPVSRERFYREALITAQLEHPGVVPIYGLGHDKAGNPCYAMKFIEGQTLGAAIQELHLDRKSSRNKAERVRRFRRLITQFVSVCRTVAFAHSRQIIHRDLKPANIMLGEYGETIIFDWGLAKSLSKSGASSEPAGSEQDDKLPHLSSPVQECLTDDMVGSPGYTSPEQNRNDPDIGPTTDIFALGATLYAILTGRSPKAMSSSPAFLQEFCWDETTSPREVNHDVPRPLDAICCKAMAFAPADRYSTAETLAADVEAWLSDSPVSAHEDRWYERAARLARHNFAWIVSGVVAMVVATAVSTFFFLEERKARTDEAAALEKAKIAHRAALDTAEELRKTYEKEQTARQDAERSKQKANDLTTAVSQQNEQLKRDLAMICIERGAIECSAGRPDRGAAFFAKAYQDLPVADKTLRASAFRLFTVWAANLGEPLLYNGQRSIALFSPEGAKVLMAVDNLLYLWDATTGKPIAKPLCHESRVTAVCFSLDGKSLITGSQDGSVQLWNVATAKPIHVYPRHAIRITAVCYSSDGKTAATGDAFGGVNVLDIVAGRSIGQPLADESAIAAVSLSPDGKRALTQNSNGTSRLWEVATGTPIGEPSGHYFVQKNRSWWGPAVTGGWVLAMTQYKMITGRHDNVARLWRIGDVSPPQLIGEPLRHEAEVTVAAFGPDGKTILTGSRDKTARLWDAATGKPVGEPLRHDGNVEFVCFGPDGKQILTVSGDKMARLWDATTGKPTSEPLRHDGDVLIICFSPDGKTVLTGSKDKTARLWNAATGAPLGEPLRHDDGVRTVAFSPDGKTVLTGSDDKTARVWDAVTTKPIGEPLLHTGGVLAVSFGLDGRTLRTEDFTGTHVWEAASHHRELVLRDFERSTAQISPDGLTVLTVGKSGRLGLWDTVTGKPIGELDDFTGPACFSPSGRILLMASKDGTVRFWDAQSRAPTGGALPQEDKVQSVCFSPDGLTVATASGKNACLWNATTAKPIRQPLRHEDNVANVTFSADGRMLLTHTVSPKRSPHLWDVATGELLWKPTDSATVQCVSPDGRRVLATSREGLNSLRPTTGCALWTGESSIQVHQEIYAMAYSPDCRKLATVQQSRGVHLRDAKTGKPIGEPILHSGIKVACFSPDGLTLGTASRDGTTRLWNAATGKPTTSPLKHTDEVCCISFSADSQKIITGSDDKTARVWNASTGAPITESLRHHGKVVAVCFSPDGKAVLTGSEDRTARIWDAATGASTGEPLQHDNVVRAVTFRPDGKMVVTGSTGGTVHLWDACTAKPIGNPLHHTDAVVAVRFSPDEKTLLAVSVSDNTRLWDVITGKALGESLQHDCKVESVCFSSNNETLLTWSENEQSRLWDVITGKPLGTALYRSPETTTFALNPNGASVAAGNRHGDLRFYDIPTLLPDEPELVRSWVAVHTAWEVDGNGFLQRISPKEWPEHRRELVRVGAKQLDRRAAEAEQQKARWHRRQAATSEARGLWFAAEYHLNRSIELDPNDADLRTRVEHVRAEQQSWERAGAGPAGIDASRLVDVEAAYDRGLRLLADDDLDGYRQTCQKMIEQFGSSSRANETYKAVSLAVLAPAAVEDLDGLVAIARRMAASHPDDPEYVTTLGAALFQAGKYEDAVHVLEMVAERTGGNMSVCAMMYLAYAISFRNESDKRDESDERAEQWMERANAAMEQPSQFQHWQELVRRRVLFNQLYRTSLNPGGHVT